MSDHKVLGELTIRYLMSNSRHQGKISCPTMLRR
jgi:hypothetical protein